MLPSGEIDLNPSEKILSGYLEKITDYWDEHVRKFHNFLNEDSLQMFVQPTVMGKQVEWSAGVSPNLYFLMNQDKDMLDDIAFIPSSFKHAFECVWKFLKRMEGFMDNYRDAHEMDTNIIKNERELEAFRKLAEKLVRQMESIEEVVSYQPLGLIFLCLCPFQELFRPQPKRIFDVITTTTPE